MAQSKTTRKQELEIGVQQLLGAVWHKAWLVAIVAVVCAVITFLGTYYLITPLYKASALFYVNNNSVTVGDASISIDSGDLSAAKSLVDSYIVILQTRETLNDVKDYAGSGRTYSELKSMVSAASVNSTEIFEVVVTSPDPKEAADLANAIAYILPSRISGIIEGTSAKIVDTAVVPKSSSYPSYLLNTLIGFLFGAIVSIACIIVFTLMDVTIREEEDIAYICKHPILAAVPDMAAESKSSYYGYTSKRNRTDERIASNSKQKTRVGNKISFAAAEAYKLLRTKLQFSFTDDGNCRIIGISSALAGEGKSLSSVNLAYSLSQLDKKVLLIDCDMRRPSISEKLSIDKIPGLSNYLSGMSGLNDLFQFCGLVDEEEAFHVITAGRNPPNPVELLSSEKMEKMLEGLRQRYDYIVLDLPPVGEVSDALAIAKQADGMLLVVRQNYCDRNSLRSAVQQFDFVDARVLGVVYNCAAEGSGIYKRRYYRQYHRKYKGGYIYSAKQNQ